VTGNSAFRQGPSAIREGRFVRLRAVRDLDRPFLYGMLTDPEIGARWRFRGAVPRPEAFERVLWDGVLAQFVVEGRRDGVPKGVVTSYGANLSAGTASMAVALAADHVRHGLGVEAAYLFCDYQFATWSLRKLYLETPEFNCGRFLGAIGRYCHVEGVLRDHEYFDGRYWDSVSLAVYRADVERFAQEHPRLVSRRTVVGTSPAAVTWTELAGSKATR
jgi:RimJ/RimL family protein N-acetyltransferase